MSRHVPNNVLSECISLLFQATYVECKSLYPLGCMWKNGEKVSWILKNVLIVSTENDVAKKFASSLACFIQFI